MSILFMLMQWGAVVRNDAPTIETLQASLLDINDQIKAINNLATAENRDLTDDESQQINSLFDDFDRVEDSIKRMERMQNMDDTLGNMHGRQTAAAAPANQNTAQPGGNNEGNEHSAIPRNVARMPAQPRDPVLASQNGFRHFGEFCQAVLNGSKDVNANIDPRLMPNNAPTTWGNEGTGADGGFAIPPAWSSEIKDLTLGEDSLLSLTDTMTSGSNTLVMPRDENQNHDTTNGVQAYWEGEGKQMKESKIDIDSMIVRLNKLTALVPMTEELMSDASGMDSYLRRKIPAKMGFKINDAIFRGNGVGRPLGIQNAKNLIVQAKESGQAADTVVSENVISMWSRMPAPNRRKAIWIINQDIEPQLITMKHPGDDSPMFIPAGGLSNSPFDTLMGRPIHYLESAETLGDQGDINFLDMSQYLTAVKTGGMRSDVSMHLYFDYDMSVFRFIMRIAGQTWANNVIQPANGNTTRSPFVTLAART